MNTQLGTLEARLFQLKNRVKQAFIPLPRHTIQSENRPFWRLQDEYHAPHIADQLPYYKGTFSRILPPSLRSRIKAFFGEEIGEDLLLEAELLTLSFATGIEDSITFPDYRTFVSNQTGNTVLFAIGASKVLATSANSTNPSYLPNTGTNPSNVTTITVNTISDYVILNNVGVSLAMFVVGGWILGHCGNYYGCYRRGWLFTSSIIQTLLVVAAVILQQHSLEEFVVATSKRALSVIALLALSAGGQVAMIRSMEMGTEITTANATSVYVDTFIDDNLFAWKNRSRNRRVLFLTFLLTGSFVGAFAHKFWGSWQTLAICAGVKALVATSLLFNKEDKEISEKKPIIPPPEYETDDPVWGTDVETDFESESDIARRRFLPLAPPTLPLPTLSPPRLSPPKLAQPYIRREAYFRADRMRKANNKASQYT